MTKVTDPYHIQTSYTYDKAGNLVSMMDGNAKTTNYAYNSLSLLASITDPANQTITYKYDKEGRLRKETDRNGQTILYDYNSDNHLTGKTIAGKEEQEKYLYSKDGNLLAAINSNIVYNYEYTPNGLVKKKLKNGEDLLAYDYNHNNQVIKVTDRDGMVTGYAYDVAGRLQKVYDGEMELAAYNYNADGTIGNISYHTGISATYGYDRNKSITSVLNKNPMGEMIGDFAYTYDNNGNQISKTENGVATAYTYDRLNRLLTAGNETYEYDNAGNRKKKTVGTDVTTYSYDARNRLAQSVRNGVATAYAYDNNGNLLSATEGTKITAYTYDGYNRLKDITMPDGSYVSNIYDPEGLRIATIENSQRYDFVFDRGSIIKETAGDGSLVARSIRGIGMVARKDAKNQLSYYLHNAHGMLSIWYPAQEKC